MENLEKLKNINVVKKTSYKHIVVIECAPADGSVLFRVEKTDYKKNIHSFFAIPNISIFVLVGILSSWITRIHDTGIRIFLALLVVLAAAAAYWFYRNAITTGVVSESVLAVKGLGIQLFAETRNGALVNARFIEKAKIKEILIVEGFTALKVIVYPAIELLASSSPKKGGNMALPFQYIEVPVAVSVDVCRGLRSTLGLSD